MLDPERLVEGRGDAGVDDDEEVAEVRDWRGVSASSGSRADGAAAAPSCADRDGSGELLLWLFLCSKNAAAAVREVRERGERERKEEGQRKVTRQ